MTRLSESLQALASEQQELVTGAQVLESRVTTLADDNTFLKGERDGAIESLDVLMLLARAYLDSPNGEDADEADALEAFLAQHSPAP